MTSTFLYYVFFSSAILFYGIGLNRTTLAASWPMKTTFLMLFKMFFSIECTTLLMIFFTYKLLVPLRLTALIPFIALMLYVALSSFIEITIRITMRKRVAEFSVSYLIIILSLSESMSVADAFFIPLFCIMSFAILTLLLHAVTFNVLKPNQDNYSSKKGLVLFSLAVLIIACLVFDVTWLNPGVLP